MITLYDKNTNAKLAYLDDIIIEDSIEITRKINGEFILKFEVLEDNLKCEYFESENYIAVDKAYFDIAYIEQIHSDSVTYRIECEHVTYRLIEDEKEFYTYDGTPTQILTDILTGTDLTVGTVEPTGITTFAVYEETNKLGLLQLLAYHTNSELDFDGFEISLKNTLGQDRGFQARFGKNLTGVKKIIDRRKGLTYYAVDIVELKSHPSFENFSELEIIEEGDTIRIIDEVIGLDVKNKVIKRTYNPLRAINTYLEIANSIEILTDSVTKIRRDTVAKDKNYHGIRISPDNGFESIRSDKMARGVFNSDIFALQTGDGTGVNWTNKLYFDAATGKYIFDGMLSATMIEALEAEFDVTVSNVTITNILAAETGYIAQLTVDSVETSTKVQNYLASNTADVNYIKIFEQYIQFITASTDGSVAEQARDRNNNLLYWKDEDRKAVVLDETDYPVMIYVYVEHIKAEFAFEDNDGIYEPIITLGLGDGVTSKSAKAEIYKGQTGLYINYYKSNTGELRQIKLTDEGVDLGDTKLISSDGLQFESTMFNINGDNNITIGSNGAVFINANYLLRLYSMGQMLLDTRDISIFSINMASFTSGGMMSITSNSGQMFINSFGESMRISSYGEFMSMASYGGNMEIVNYGESMNIASYSGNMEIAAYDNEVSIKSIGDGSYGSVAVTISAGYGIKSDIVIEPDEILITTPTDVFINGEEVLTQPDKEELETLISDLEDAITNLEILINNLENVKADKEQPDWITATLESGWTGTLQYRKNQIWQIEVNLNINSGTITPGTIISNLPEGFRPKQFMSIPVYQMTDGKVGQFLIIGTSGDITVPTLNGGIENSKLYQGATVFI